MIKLQDCIMEGYGGINITVTLDDLLTFASTLLQGVQKKSENTSDPEEEFLSPSQVMSYLNIKRTTLHNWGKQGILTPQKINRKCYYRKTDIIALQKGQKNNKC